MGHAYTPGLKVSAAAEFVRARILPIHGEVLVKQGDQVEPETVVARALLPGNVVTQHLSKELGMAASDVAEMMLVKAGDEVSRDQPVARSKGIFGMMKQTVVAPTTGVLESVSAVSGQAIYREEPIPVEVKAYISGVVSEVTEDLGVAVSARGTMVQGIFGIGPEVSGQVVVLVDDPTRPVTVSDISPEHKGKVLLGGSLADLATMRRAIEVDAAALIIGGIDATDLKTLLGYDLGVAITGTETIGLTIVVTEGFGQLDMSARTHKLLSSAAGAVASVSGATQIRAGVMRPEILIPQDVEAVEETAVDTGLLAVDSSIRIIRDPHFGALGKVVDLPPELQPLETEASVRILTVTLPDGQRVTLPRANVELVDESL
jgi:biotin carboxyl carrier protein